ncbi:MAG: histidinol-phosphate transaminase [Eubacteriales bacterium]|nr:histidinol-phosphate transaminase [Eubacteriales bacterium]
MSRFLKNTYAKLEAYTPGEQPKDGEYIKLNTNESPFPPAPEVTEVLEKEDIERLRLYCDPTSAELKGKLAELYGVSSENVFLSNGSDDILNFSMMAWSGKGAVFPDITYGFYPVFAELHGVEYEEIPLKEDFTVDASDYIARDKLIFIANPNAPTGIEMPLSEIERIVASNSDTVVVIDEAYVDFGGTSALPLIEKYENLLVVRTFSKSRCLAGGRLGYAFGCKALIEDLEKIKYSTNPYNINSLTAKLGCATVDADSYYTDRCKEIIKNREYTAKALETLGFTVLKSKSNFIFAKSDKISGEDLYLKLKKRKILVRHFSKERIRDFNRITIGTKAEMDALLENTEEILKEI